MYLSLGSPENRPRTKGLCALMLSRSIFYTTECRWGNRGEGRNKRELFEVLRVIIVWSQWNRLPGGHINDCLLGLFTGGAWIYLLSPFFLDQSFALWDINSLWVTFIWVPVGPTMSHVSGPTLKPWGRGGWETQVWDKVLMDGNSMKLARVHAEWATDC